AEANGRRSECDWPRHYPRRRAAHDRRHLAEPAVLLGRTERRGLDDEAVHGSRIVTRTSDARGRLSARDRAVETGDDDRTGAGRAAVARTKLSCAKLGQDRQLISDDA